MVIVFQKSPHFYIFFSLPIWHPINFSLSVRVHSFVEFHLVSPFALLTPPRILPPYASFALPLFVGTVKCCFIVLFAALL